MYLGLSFCSFVCFSFYSTSFSFVVIHILLFWWICPHCLCSEISQIHHCLPNREEDHHRWVAILLSLFNLIQLPLASGSSGQMPNVCLFWSLIFSLYTLCCLSSRFFVLFCDSLDMVMLGVCMHSNLGREVPILSFSLTEVL